MKFFIFVQLLTAFSVFYSLDQEEYLPRGNISGSTFVEPVFVTDIIKRQRAKSALYHIKIQSEYAEFTKSIPLCLLQASNFEEQIMLHLDQNGLLYHFDYLVHAHECNGKTSKASKFKSQIVSYKTVSGPKPILQKPVLTEKVEQSQSFLVKYWYIFLPLVLFVLFAPADDEKK